MAEFRPIEKGINAVTKKLESFAGKDGLPELYYHIVGFAPVGLAIVSAGSLFLLYKLLRDKDARNRTI